MQNDDAMIDRIVSEIRPYSMVPDSSIAKTVRLTLEAIDAGLPGDIVECGTWKGGSSFAMLLAQRYKFGSIKKPVWMFDSFQGLPPVDERDGPLAMEYQENAFAPGNYDNCNAPLDEVKSAIAKFGFSDDEARIVPGWFDETVPVHLDSLRARGIAVLRVDCDWYEPVHFILHNLADCVTEEGPIIIDDYYAWDGCARAVHTFLHENDLSYRIRSGDEFFCAWMYKRASRVGPL